MKIIGVFLIYVANSLFFNFPISFLIFENYTRFLCVFFLFLICELKNHEKCVLDHNALIFIFYWKYLL